MKPFAVVATAGAVLAAVATAIAGAVVWGGLYDISAAVQHTSPVYAVLQLTGERSIKRNAAGIAEPRLDEPAMRARGALCYRDKCLVCHGGPGVVQGDGRIRLTLGAQFVRARRLDRDVLDVDLHTPRDAAGDREERPVRPRRDTSDDRDEEMKPGGDEDEREKTHLRGPWSARAGAAREEFFRCAQFKPRRWGA